MLLTCGEATIDLVSSDGVTFVARPGGSAMNTAVAGVRLGGRFGVLARLSTDGFGRRIRSHLAAEGVDLSGVSDVDEPNVVALATAGRGGGAEYRFFLDGAADWQWTRRELAPPGPEVDAVLFGSMAIAVPPGDEAILSMVEDLHRLGTATVVLDPNFRAVTPPGAERLERAVAASDVVKASSDDLAALYPGEATAEVAGRWLAAGPQLVVVTLGGDGVEVYRRGGSRLWVPAPAVDVADTIGAGDTFSAGLLTFLAEEGALGERPAQRLRRIGDEALTTATALAAQAAAMCCERVGADPPTRAELARRYAVGA